MPSYREMVKSDEGTVYIVTMVSRRMQVITIMVVIASSRDDGVAPPLLPLLLPLPLPLSVENEADTLAKILRMASRPESGLTKSSSLV